MLASSELGGNARLHLLDKGDWEKWHDHPYGYPISHVAICSAENIIETPTLRWFRGVPDGMIDDHGHHGKFFNSVMRRVTKDRLI